MYLNIHVKKIGIDNKSKTFIQSIVLKKTLEAISFDYRRNNMLNEFRWDIAVAESCEETVRLVELEDGIK